MIEHNVLMTGSTGNCVIVNKSVMIDCGVPYKTVSPYMDDIKLVLLTHIHSDHFKASTLKKMAFEKPSLQFGVCSWLLKPLVEAGVSKRQINVLTVNLRYYFGICYVIPVEMVHDVPNVGYKLQFKDGKVFYATDTGTLSHVIAKGYDLYLVENNYEDAEIRARMDAKIESGQYVYEYRAMQYHLSKNKCDDWLERNRGPTSEFVYLHGHVER